MSQEETPLRSQQPDNEGLPDGWVTAAVRDVIEDAQPGFACGDKHVEDGLRHLRMNNIGEEGSLSLDLIRTVPSSMQKPQYSLSAGDVLVCTTNSGKLVGKCAEFSLLGAYAFSNHITRLRPARDAIVPSFLNWQLWANWKSGGYEDYCRHWVNQSTLPKEHLLDTDLVVPPIAEQKRIVAKVEELLARVNAARERLARVPAILKRFRQSVLAAACSGQLTVEWRECRTVDRGAEERMSPTHSSLGCSQLAPLPETWSWCALRDVADYRGGYAYQSKRYVGSGPNQVIRIGNVRPGVIDTGLAPVFIDEAYAQETDRFKLCPGDIVISQTGTRYKRDYGYAAVVLSTPMRLYLNQRVGALRSNGSVLPRFLNYWMLTETYRDYFFENETGNVNQGNVGANALQTAPVPIPQLDEQREIVRRVEALFALADRTEARVRAAIERAEKLPQAILARAFRGELVPTEAELARLEGRDYEPASVLLERIRAERAETGKASLARPRKSRGNARSEAASAASTSELLVAEPGEEYHSTRRASVSAQLSMFEDAALAPPPSSRAAATPRPKSKPTGLSPKAAAQAVRSFLEHVKEEAHMYTIRTHFATSGPLERKEAIRELARREGHERTGARIRDEFDKGIRTAVRRGILKNEAGRLSLVARTIDEYSLDHLVTTLLQVVRGSGWIARDDATRMAANRLGFQRVGPNIKKAFKSAINAAIRRGLLEHTTNSVRAN